jgi:hypothetical protein
MSRFLDGLAMLDWIDRIEGLVSSFINADWHGAGRRAGLPGLLAEAGRTLTGSNRWRFETPREAEWAGAEVERLLRHYGIRVWGRGFTDTTVYFYVKERQANWAEYLLLRRGIPLVGPLYNPANAAYARQYAPGNRPPAWADRDRGLLDRLDDWLL